MEELIRIIEFVTKSFLHIWPYLLLTIPLAVIINISGASKYISGVFSKNPLIAILLATIIGAFSPFCSCGVIPVISSLLIGGVPLAPVMSFWIASPSMDPEIFFLSSSIIGWKLAVWRLASTFFISLLAGYMTHFLNRKGLIGNVVIKSVNAGCDGNSDRSCGCSSGTVVVANACEATLIKGSPVSAGRILREVWKAAFMVAKFMGLAFLLTALITFYVPQDLISGIVKTSPSLQVLMATLIGIPAYTSNITALPLVSGLLQLGLNEGAALAFLIAGATTTLPALVAVSGITGRRIFLLYLAFVLFGALFTGIVYNLF